MAGNYNDNGRHVVTYFYDNVNLEYVSGRNNPEGVKGTQLEEPLVVRMDRRASFWTVNLFLDR